MFAAVPGSTKNELEPILGKTFVGYASGNFSDFERQKELLSMGLPDSLQPITIVIMVVIMAIRWLEAHVKEINRQEIPKKEQLEELDCLKDLDLFETMWEILNILMKVMKIWAS